MKCRYATLFSLRIVGDFNNKYIAFYKEDNMTSITFKEKEEKKYYDLLTGEFFFYGNHLYIKASDYSAIDISGNGKTEQFDTDEDVTMPKNINIEIDM